MTQTLRGGSTTAVRSRPVVAGQPELPGGMAGRIAVVLDKPLASYLMILGCTLLLLGLGIVMVFSASSVTQYAHTGSSLGIVGRQLMWAGFGLPAMYVASRLPARGSSTGALRRVPASG